MYLVLKLRPPVADDDKQHHQQSEGNRKSHDGHRDKRVGVEGRYKAQDSHPINAPLLPVSYSLERHQQASRERADQ